MKEGPGMTPCCGFARGFHWRKPGQGYTTSLHSTPELRVTRSYHRVKRLTKFKKTYAMR